MERRAAVFAVRPDLAQALMSGEKRFEFRRVRPTLDYGDTVFVYSTSPEKAIIGTFTCGTIVEGSPLALWRRLGHRSGTSRARFLGYFADTDVAYAIEVMSPAAWREPLSLSTIRHRIPGFHPPQSYRFLLPRESLTRVISSHAANGTSNRNGHRERPTP